MTQRQIVPLQGFSMVMRARRLCGGIAVLCVACGCSIKDLQTPQRYEQGLVIILPGIEGKGPLNVNIAKGLNQGGVPSAIEIHDWSALSVATWFINLTAEGRNRRCAADIARRIQVYQHRYPERPIHLIGHSGGGGVAVYALEALPPDRPITSAMLLAPALSPEYDLRRALRRTTCGIWNFYSDKDVGFLRLGTTIFGTIDRAHGSAAGAVGFREPPGIGTEGAKLYAKRLHQVRYTDRMARSGNMGGHSGWASQQFTREWIAPLLYSQIAAVPVVAPRQIPDTLPALGGGEANNQPGAADK